MSGAALNFVHSALVDFMLTGTPSKSFVDPDQYMFDTFTNLAPQTFRVDQSANAELKPTQETVFQFTIPTNQGDVLKETYFVMTLPDLYSPLWPPSAANDGKWAPSEVRWIRDLVVAMTRVEVVCGTTTLCQYSGQAVKHLVERDRSLDMRGKFDELTGNVQELYDPAHAHGRMGAYPSCYWQGGECEPSVRGRTISFPLHTFFCQLPGFPLYRIGKNDLRVRVTIRPVQELLQARDVFDPANGFPYLAPDQNKEQFQLFRFLQSPKGVDVAGTAAYANSFNTWRSDAHLECKTLMMGEAERQTTVHLPWRMLVREIHEYSKDGVVQSDVVPIRSNAGVSVSLIWYAQRSDVAQRNEWTNYTNWPYRKLPVNVRFAPAISSDPSFPAPASNDGITNTGLFISGPLAIENQKDILLTTWLMMDGCRREDIAPAARFEYRNRYWETRGGFSPGVHTYLFCLHSDAEDRQPTGAAPLSEFKRVELALTTIVPVVSSEDKASTRYVCGQEGNVIYSSNSEIFEYTFSVHVIEERFNIVHIQNGICSLMFTR